MSLPATPALTTDICVFNSKGELLLIRRSQDPFKGSYSLPGGFVAVGEEVEQAVRRGLKEETGVDAGKELMFFGIYSHPKRDPRGHSVSIAYLSLVDAAHAKAGRDAASVEWVKDFAKLDLAFDHNAIVTDAVGVLMSMRQR